MSVNIPSLSALTAAALALPGLAQAEMQTDLLYSHYAEADLPGSRTENGLSSERYTIDSLLFRLTAPLGAQSLAVNATVESMSGASPWYIRPEAGSGRPLQIMSGASIDETRVDVQGSVGVEMAGLDWDIALGYSKEEDYEAINGGLETEYTPQEANYTLSGGIGYSYDRLDPTVGTSSPNVIDDADKDSLSLYGGATWIINAQTVLQTTLSYGLHDGFLNDPYKWAWIVDRDNAVNDSRPGERKQIAISTRLRHYIGNLGAAVHADYRYYSDDWDIEAHTLELAWNQIIDASWRITPAIRWYSQSQAEFYAPYYASLRNDGYASSDYRLSPYGALSLRLDVRKALGEWELGGGLEWYKADGDYAIGSVKVENPALVEFLGLNLRLSKRFGA
ncbi:MAG TPA: DUF3570 domain-containing protein [Fontimonas sp.]